MLVLKRQLKIEIKVHSFFIISKPGKFMTRTWIFNRILCRTM